MQAAVMLPEEACASENGLSNVNSNPCNNINSCVILELTPSNSHFKVRITLKGRNRSTAVAAMVDCGATALFISRRFMRENKIRTHLIPREIPLYNIDGSRNCTRGITCLTRLQLKVGDTEEWRVFLVTDLGLEDVVLGLLWLRRVNPDIDWAQGKLKINSIIEEANARVARVEQIAANRVQRRKWYRIKVLDDCSEQLWCVAGYTYSAELAEKAGKEKRKRTFEEIVPSEY
jgi:hypothetical protein